MALEVACTATTFDFTKPAEERLLFPLVDTADNPEINEDAIRNNLVYLHDRILGDTVGPTSRDDVGRTEVFDGEHPAHRLARIGNNR